MGVKYIRRIYNKIVSSIAFYPMLISILFMLLSWQMLMLDVSGWGISIKSQWSWIHLKDSQTARAITSTIAAAILSLTVFSFSIVMIILNQAATQISNRTLASMLENRFQQIVLGFYLGTIVYALLTLSTIRSTDDNVNVPALSIYLLMAFTVVDIFLFIYFLHFATQTVKYDTIINRIHKQTCKSFNRINKENDWNEPISLSQEDRVCIMSPESGYFQGFDKNNLLRVVEKRNVILKFLYPVGTYLLKNVHFLTIHDLNGFQGQQKDDEILSYIDFYPEQLPQQHYYFGFLHLTEIAVKTLSPGINDPSTAVLSLHALSDLFARLMNCPPQAFLKSKNGKAGIIQQVWALEMLFHKCIDPIRQYGKNDQFINEALANMTTQLSALDKNKKFSGLFKSPL